MPRSKFTSARSAWATLFALLAVGVPLLFVGGATGAAVSTVPLGTAGNFAVLAGTGITDIPTSSLTGAVGVSPATGATITGLTCAEVTGAIYTVDAAGPACRVPAPGRLTSAKNALTTAYNDAAGRSPDTTYGAGDHQLTGKTLIPGVYRFGSAATANLSGNLTLKGDASSVWIFQATSDFVTAGSSTVTLTGGAQSCNVFWQVGSSATLGGSSSLVGTVMAGASITVGTGATIAGRLLAQALVTLDSDTVTRPSCSTVSSSGGSTPARELYCDPSGKTYDLIAGQDKEAPYDTLGLVPAYVDPVTGAKSCDFPAAAVTPTETTVTAPTTTATTATAPASTTPAPAPAPPKAQPAKKAVVSAATKTVVAKRAQARRAAHVPPQPAQHGFGFTG